MFHPIGKNSVLVCGWLCWFYSFDATCNWSIAGRPWMYMSLLDSACFLDMFLFLCLMSYFLCIYVPGFLFASLAVLVSFFLEHSEPPLFMRPGGMWFQALSKPFWLPRTSPFGCTRIHSARPLSQTTRMCVDACCIRVSCVEPLARSTLNLFRLLGTIKFLEFWVYVWVLSLAENQFFVRYSSSFYSICPVQGYLPIPPQLKKQSHELKSEKKNGSEWHSSAEHVELSRIFLVNICECQVWRLQCCFHSSFMAFSALVHNMKNHLRLGKSSDFVVGYFCTQGVWLHFRCNMIIELRYVSACAMWL